MTTGVHRLIFGNHFYEEKEKPSFQPTSLEILGAKSLPEETEQLLLLLHFQFTDQVSRFRFPTFWIRDPIHSDQPTLKWALGRWCFMKARKPKEIQSCSSPEAGDQSAPHLHQSACLATSCQGQNSEYHGPGVFTSAAPPTWSLTLRQHRDLAYTESHNSVATESCCCCNHT